MHQRVSVDEITNDLLMLHFESMGIACNKKRHIHIRSIYDVSKGHLHKEWLNQANKGFSWHIQRCSLQHFAVLWGRWRIRSGELCEKNILSYSHELKEMLHSTAKQRAHGLACFLRYGTQDQSSSIRPGHPDADSELDIHTQAGRRSSCYLMTYISIASPLLSPAPAFDPVDSIYALLK